MPNQPAKQSPNVVGILQPPDFSLVLGGPLFQLFCRMHLSGTTLELLGRRILATSLFVYLPAFLFALWDGLAFGTTVHIPFVKDVEAHGRFLVALPALLTAEVMVNQRISPLVRRFVDGKIVVSEDLPAFSAAVKSAMRLRNSVVLEAVQLILVYTFGLWSWWNRVAVGAGKWYALPEGVGWNLTPAGYWFAFVSIPSFQFILLRWFTRLLIWYQLLWRISRLNLHLSGAHPDRAGGIGFLGDGTYAFGPLLFAAGALLSGMIAGRVLYEGQALIDFMSEAIGWIGAMVLFVMGPLLMFTPKLDRARRKSATEFGSLANQYISQFERKWIQSTGRQSDKLLGSSDIQSLADMGNSYSVISEMRLVPFTIRNITQLAVATAAPLLPLGLTVFSLDEFLGWLLKTLF